VAAVAETGDAGIGRAAAGDAFSLARGGFPPAGLKSSDGQPDRTEITARIPDRNDVSNGSFRSDPIRMASSDVVSETPMDDNVAVECGYRDAECEDRHDEGGTPEQGRAPEDGLIGSESWESIVLPS
jgi:hypothetical protein